MLEGDDKVVRVRELTTSVRKQVLVLMCAINDRDDDLTLIAAVRVRDALRTAQRIASDPLVSGAAELAAMVEAARQTAEPWLARVSRQSAATRRLGVRLDVEQAPRLEPLESASDLMDLDLNGAHIDQIDLGGLVLTGLRAKGARLQIANARGARLAWCELTACELTASRLDESMIEHCQFERSNLEGTSWESAQVSSCTFTDASLVDARLDDAVLRECNFRGADLSVIDATLPDGLVRAIFIRCDLRDTRWSGRSLAGAHLFECKLHGAHGAPIAVDSIEIVRPDLSELGDRSRVGSQSEVLAMWMSPPRSFARL